MKTRLNKSYEEVKLFIQSCDKETVNPIFKICIENN